MTLWPPYPYTDDQLRSHASFLAAERDRLIDKIDRFEECLVWLAGANPTLIEAARLKFNL